MHTAGPAWEADLQGVPPRLLAFWRFFRDNIAALASCSLSVRDLLAWATFVRATAPRLGTYYVIFVRCVCASFSMPFCTL